MKKLSFLLLALFLIGCATTIKELKERGHKIVFSADENFQSVYRKIIFVSRECFQVSFAFGGGSMVVQGDIYHDIKYANVTIALVGLSVINYIQVDISSLSDNTSKVEVYYYNVFWEPVAKAVEKWVKEDYRECRVYPKEEPIDERTKGRWDVR